MSSDATRSTRDGEPATSGGDDAQPADIGLLWAQDGAHADGGQAQARPTEAAIGGSAPQPPRTPPAHASPAYARPPATAAAITSETMLRPRGQPPEGGWRHVVYAMTGGLVNPGPSRQEFERRQLVARVKAPVSGSRRIAVISRKGGVGKTTTTLMLGHTFASLRGDRVIALDANPDAGSLGYRVNRETSATVTDLLDDAEHIRRYADIRAYTSQAATRLEVVASDDDPHISQAIGEHEYHTAVGLLDHHYNLILLDTGTGILDSATKGILGVADQLVVVLAPSLDGARAASLTLDWLMQHGYDGLVSNSVAVVNQSRQHGLVELGKLQDHFSERCRAVVRIPWDPYLEAGAETGLDDLKRATRDAYLALAAHVADGFAVPSQRA